ncbi:phosphodiesterase [Kiloniella sp. EL199]|uniref:phosphodiesterase n=1 Tax=Kiloniella sp. EL199 TaxID=2107581 RepID=UPI000EA0A427|nr:phosphodiesterase [Kiloniella sp. EL199]
MRKVTKFVQLTDTHIVREGELAYGVVNTAEYLERAVKVINGLLEYIGPIDGVVVTGDLADFGAAEEYQRFKELIKPLKFPVFVLPGNHDNREQMRTAFDFTNETGPLNAHVKFGDCHLITLDSLVTGSPHGLLTDKTLDWLKCELGELGNEPVSIALHHPPFVTGIGHMDRQRLRNSEQFLNIVAQHKGAKQVICGHVHRHITYFDKRCPIVISPSPAHAVALDHRENGPSDFTLEPGGILLHTLIPETRDYCFRSEFVPVSPFKGPYSFGL